MSLPNFSSSAECHNQTFGASLIGNDVVVHVHAIIFVVVIVKTFYRITAVL